jgi:predicted 3-demethylubiquinone-9 3-methyltransferase (glyoxalase superfamily)
MSKITPFLWFDHQAEEAMNFYVSIFRNSRVIEVTRYGDAGPGPKGSVMTASFEVDGQRVTALNGGPVYKLNGAFSFVVHCGSQREVDDYWKKLTAGGQEIQCGWLTDKFGVTWQIVPDALLELLKDKDAKMVQRVMRAMFPMKKLDIATLERAAAGK